jgi:endonuclease/exonuclease/phosphatase (EEP) superfamily protein YafD
LLEADADVILVQELSDEWDALLRQSGVYDRYPHRVTEPHPLDRDYFGIGILSRLPLVEHEIKGLAYEAVPFARADVEVGGRRVRFYSIHTMPPMSGAMLRVLGQQAGQLEAMLRADYADPSLAAVVAGGDFNASPTSYVYRRLRATGATAAHEAAGRGLALTWPNGLFLYPPMRLDHLFVHGVHVAGVRELDHGASDHSPLAAELVLPGAP